MQGRVSIWPSSARAIARSLPVLAEFSQQREVIWRPESDHLEQRDQSQKTLIWEELNISFPAGRRPEHATSATGIVIMAF